MNTAYRVVVVEDDPDVALYTRTVLEKRAGCIVRSVDTPFDARAIIAEFKPDVVVTDIEMPGMTGLQLIEQIRADRPELPVIVMTAFISEDYSDAALGAHADAFLVKPISSADLVSTVSRVAEAGRERARAGIRQPVVLAIGAHPSDVESGIGAILTAHREAGDSVAILTLGARGPHAGQEQEAAASAALLGARLYRGDLTEFDPREGGTTVAVIERIVAEADPTIVYTLSANDEGLGHRAIHDATVIATRSVPLVASYQTRSSTIDFHPNRFVNIDVSLDAKLALLDSYAGQGETPLHLQHETVVATARYWGRYVDGTHAEPLEVLRDLGAATR